MTPYSAASILFCNHTTSGRNGAPARGVALRDRKPRRADYVQRGRLQRNEGALTNHIIAISVRKKNILAAKNDEMAAARSLSALHQVFFPYLELSFHVTSFATIPLYMTPRIWASSRPSPRPFAIIVLSITPLLPPCILHHIVYIISGRLLVPRLVDGPRHAASALSQQHVRRGQRRRPAADPRPDFRRYGRWEGGNKRKGGQV